MTLAFAALVPVAAFAAVTKLHLKGRSHKQYDSCPPVTFEVDPDSQGVKAVEDYLYENFIKPAQSGSRGNELLSAKRARFEAKGLSRDFPVTFTSGTAEMDGVRVDGEWTQAPGADPDRRVLYLHGGAFTVGSAISHRAIISNLALRTGCSVFAPNYRLMPENPRIASIIDARAAYKWILENGPDGPAAVQKLAVAGDSAGGNLALMLSNWARDEGLRAADAVAGLSPSTDSTFESPSIKNNFDTDTMLRPLVGPMLKIPRTVLLWGAWKNLSISPASPMISPLRGDLSGLPPTLIQVSAAEMLYDDSVRYAAKAKAQGSDVTLQTWSHLCHVWQAFDTLLPEAVQALDEIGNFLITHGVGKAQGKAS
ncbi:MAG: alpha/beta hydrolase [Alphaproteobacteria bacterium]